MSEWVYLCSPSDSSSQLHEATMEQSLDAWPWGHDASSMSSPLSLYTSRQVRRTARTYTQKPKLHRVPNFTHIHILQTQTQIISLFTSWAAPTNVHSPNKLRRNVGGASSPMFVRKQPVRNSTNLMINDCVCYPSPPPSLHPSVPLSSPSSANNKYLSGGLPRVYAVLDVSDPGVFLQRVDGFQDVLSPVFHLWKQPNTLWSHTDLCSKDGSFSNNLFI